jgi:hypothetical protein
MLAVAGLALQGCGGDDNGGISAADMARIDAAEAAAEAAAASAEAAEMAAEEAATMDDDMEMDDTSDLEDRIADLEEATKDMPVGLPMLEDASALTRDVAILSQDAEKYDVSMVTATLAAGASAMSGHYAGKAMTGFGGLDVTDAGGDGANIFGSWLQYSHWGVVETKSGRVADNRLAIFSVGEKTGSNPMPIGGQMSAMWTGSMVGSWDEAARVSTPSERLTTHANNKYLMENAQGTPITRTGAIAEDNADNQGVDVPAMNVRGTAKIAVNFVQTAGGPTSSAGLAISGLSGDRGRFRPGDAHTDASDTADDNSLMVWTGMEITAGDFARRDFNRYGGMDGVYADSGGVGDIHDRAGAMRYLAGRFYGTDGMEVGGVFMENGEISGRDNVFGVDTTGDEETGRNTVADQLGVLHGAFGATRVVP